MKTLQLQVRRCEREA